MTCKECGIEIEYKPNRKYCKKCAIEVQKIRVKKYNTFIREHKDESESLYFEKDDLTQIASVSDMIDIQHIVKKVKKGYSNVQEIYDKYKNIYDKKRLEKYIERCMY